MAELSMFSDSLRQNKPSQQAQPPPQGLVETANEIERRLKILEDRYSTLRKKTQTTDENLLASERKFSKEFKMAQADTLEMKRSISLLQEKMGQFASELAAAAKKPDLRMLEAYASFLEPMQFATRQDLKAAIAEAKTHTKKPE